MGTKERELWAEFERNRDNERKRQLAHEAELQERQREAKEALRGREKQENSRMEQEELTKIRLKLEESERREEETRKRLAELERRIREQDERERELTRRAELQQRNWEAEQGRQKKEREEHARKDEERRLKEASLQEIGVQVDIRSMNQWGSLGQGGNAHDLSMAILKQMKIIKRSFLKNLPNLTIKKIEYIMNDNLYNQFNATKAEFRKYGRNTKEMLLFHGTNQQNMDRFSYSKRR